MYLSVKIACSSQCSYLVRSIDDHKHYVARPPPPQIFLQLLSRENVTELLLLILSSEGGWRVQVHLVHPQFLSCLVSYKKLTDHLRIQYFAPLFVSSSRYSCDAMTTNPHLRQQDLTFFSVVSFSNLTTTLRFIKDSDNMVFLHTRIAIDLLHLMLYLRHCTG